MSDQISMGASRNALRSATTHADNEISLKLILRTLMYRHMKMATAGTGALALVGMGVLTAVDGGVAEATSSSSIGGAGATAVQETGIDSQPATTVVVSASPAVKAPPDGGGIVQPGITIPK
jgi:hypothetical protein